MLLVLANDMCAFWGDCNLKPHKNSFLDKTICLCILALFYKERFVSIFKISPHKQKKVLKGRKAFTTALSWFVSDALHFCVHPYNICGEASAHLYGEAQSF